MNAEMPCSPHAVRGTAEVRVHIILLEGVELLDLAGPSQVLHSANGYGARYAISFVGPASDITAAQGLRIARDQHLPIVEAGDLIIVPGTNAASRASPGSDVVEWLRLASSRGARIAAVCSGAFLLGHAGLLNGRRSTTHWSLLPTLAKRYPRTLTQESALFVEDDGVITSAGIASGIDMALWIVERDHGPLVAAKVAREIVIYMRRDADHGQLSVFLDYRSHLNPAVHRAQDFLVANFATTITLPALAAVAGTSGRHLARSFKSVTGLTPAAYQRKLRLDFAKTLLNDTELSIEVVAARAGFADGRSLRRLWHLEFGSSPSSHRLRHV